MLQEQESKQAQLATLIEGNLGEPLLLDGKDSENPKMQNCIGKLINGYIHINKTDTDDLKYQVAGHARVGLLTHKLGYVLKPVQKEPLGTREIEFYQNITKHRNPTTTTIKLNKHNIIDEDQQKCFDLLQKVLPKFYGIGIIVENDSQQQDDKESDKGDQLQLLPVEKYLIIDNIILGFEAPCVVDLKIGAQTWDPDAPETKINHEKEKYIGTKSQIGISVTGMHYYDLTTNVSIRCQDGFGKKLTTESIYTVLNQFLNSSYYGIHKLIAQIVLDKLIIIKEIFNIQKMYHFYSSSILIAYDTKYLLDFFKMNNNVVVLNEPENTNEAIKSEADNTNKTSSISMLIELLKQNQDSWLKVWMIDFAHVHPNLNGETLDVNYIFGLDNLITIFTNIMNDKLPSSAMS